MSALFLKMYEVLIRKAAAVRISLLLVTHACFDSLRFPLQLNMTFHLFIVALAGAGAAVIAMVRPCALGLGFSI